MAAKMWRAPVSKVVQAGKFGVIQDGGVMNPAYRSSKPPGYYFFNDDHPIAAKPMVLVGTMGEVLEFFKTKKSGIENRIKELPEIYMNVEIYKPKPRFVGLFPFLDAIAQLTEQSVGILSAGFGNIMGNVGGSVHTVSHNVLELTGGAKDLKEAYSHTKQPYKKAFSERKKSSGGSSKGVQPLKYAISWTYLPEKGYKNVAKGSVSFDALYLIVVQELKAVLGA